MQERDWAAVRAVLVVEWPASSERIVGAERFVGFNAAYPGGWTIDALRLVEDPTPDWCAPYVERVPG